MKKLKILRMETEEEEHEQVIMEINIQTINHVDYFVFKCPKCQTVFGIPVDTLKGLLVVRKRPQGVV